MSAMQNKKISVNSIPEITNINNIDNKLTFDVRNVHCSIVNSIRRTVLTRINTLVFRAFPYNQNDIDIDVNNTKFNNEYLKHRISCLPIHINDSSLFQNFVESYEVQLDVINEGLEKLYVTTKDLKIVNKITKKELPKEEVSKIFPADPITGDHILICILYPNYNKGNENCEQLKLKCNFKIGNAKENSCWNVVSNCTYENTKDIEKIEKIRQTPEFQSQSKLSQMDYMLLDAQRIFIPNKFKFTVESIGIFTNEYIMKMACEYLINQLSSVLQMIQDKPKIVSIEENRFNTTNGMLTSDELENIQNQYASLYKENKFFILELKDDDYSIGKMIENYLFNSFEDKLKFVAFKKKYPSEPESYIYIQYKDELNEEVQLYEHLYQTCSQLVEMMKSIQNKFM